MRVLGIIIRFSFTRRIRNLSWLIGTRIILLANCTVLAFTLLLPINIFDFMFDIELMLFILNKQRRSGIDQLVQFKVVIFYFIKDLKWVKKINFIEKKLKIGLFTFYLKNVIFLYKRFTCVFLEVLNFFNIL